MNVMLFAIPVFFILIGLELVVAKMQQTKLYRLNDAVSNISCGITQQVAGVFFKVLTVAAYVVLYDLSPLRMPDTWWSWVILFVLIDCLYYWFHRYSHEINAFWGAHVVHHQSEEYNLSVALRQSIFQSLVSGVFYLPLALMGFDPVAFVLLNIFQTLYQFWIHTETIGKMPRWFEYIFNTPSHHRVHHGRNPQYIDRNHGGTLIIFDRMFGTFEPEGEKVVYGVTKPLASFNSVWANFDYFKTLGEEMRGMRWYDKIRLLVAEPGWRPKYLGGPLKVPKVSRDSIEKYDQIVPQGLNWYVLLHYVFLLLGTTVFLMAAGKNPFTWTAALLAGLVFLSVFNLGGILEKKRWVMVTEYLRLVAIPVALWLMFGMVYIVQILIIVFAVLGIISAIWFSRYLYAFGQSNSLNLEKA